MKVQVLTGEEVLAVEETYGTPSPTPNALSPYVRKKGHKVSDFYFTGEFRPPVKGDYFLAQPSTFNKENNLWYIEHYIFNFSIGPRLILTRKEKGK